jgi:hypothetical protein
MNSTGDYFTTPGVHLCELPKQFAAGLACQVPPLVGSEGGQQKG